MVSRDRSSSPRALATVVGPVYFDLVFSGFSAVPVPGQEVRATGLASSPGGTANVAVGLSRLGVHVAVLSAFATDAFGRYLWSSLEQEGIDLSFSYKCPGWSTPVTVSMSYALDRSLVTHEVPPPVRQDALLEAASGSHFVIVGLEACSIRQLRSLREAGAVVVADVCWDATGHWASDVVAKLAAVDVFLPNAVEAMAYTGTSSPKAALARLSEHSAGTVVVKDGAHGAIASDGAETASSPAIRVSAVDPTGAGDVFDAAFIYGTFAGWSLVERLRFANLCAGLSVQRTGGALAAPCWDEVRNYCATEPTTEWTFLHPTFNQQKSGSPCTRAFPTFSLSEMDLPTSPRRIRVNRSSSGLQEEAPLLDTSSRSPTGPK